MTANYPSATGRPFTAGLRAQRDPLGVEGVAMGFARGEEVFGEQEPADYVYRVVRGAVRACRLMTDGRRQISEFYLPGDLFGLEAGRDHAVSTEAACDAVVFVMPRRPLFILAERDCGLARRLWLITLHDLQRSQDHLLMLGRKNAAERVACFLLDMAVRIPADRTVTLPVSRQDIADYLGLTIETVSRTMTQLQDERLIALQGCREILLRDRRALEAMAAG